MNPDGQNDADDAIVQTRCAFLLLWISFVLMLCLSKQQSTPKTKLAGSEGGRVPRTTSSRRAPVIKAEPVDEGLRSPPNISAKKSEIRFSSPIVISSSESDDPTLKAKPSKGKAGPSTSNKQKSSRISDDLQAWIESKETVVDTQKKHAVVLPLSETTVYLEDMWVLPRSSFPCW